MGLGRISMNVKNQSPQQFLVGLLGSSPQRFVGDLVVDLDESLCDDILSEARRQGVLPMLYYSLNHAGLLAEFPEQFVDQCKASWRQTTLTNLRLVHTVGQLAFLFQAAQIPVVALKGIYLAVHIYPHSGMRQMGDIDLLVPERDLSQVREILFAQGYKQLADFAYDDIQAEIEIAHHLAPFVKEGSPTIELHWHIVKPGESHFVFPVDELWRRTVPCAIGQASALALTKEATFVHLCMHVSYHHLFAFGLRPLVDVHTMVSTFGEQLDWDEIAACGNSWQANRGILLTLAVAHRLFGTQIPRQFKEAEDIPEEVQKLVVEQIFSDASDSHNLTLLAKLYSQSSLWARLKTALKRIFIQPYPIFSWAYVRFVLTRTVRLVTLYRGDILRIYGPQKDRAFTNQAARYAKIHHWLK